MSRIRFTNVVVSDATGAEGGALCCTGRYCFRFYGQDLVRQSISVFRGANTSIYLPARSGPLYLSLVTDAYSRKIVGHHVHEGMHAESVATAFKQVLRKRCRNHTLVHHSDRGIQYCSALYQSLHERHGISCSMTDGYDCYQNALAERINGILKTELLLSSPEDLHQARKMVEEAVQIYNTERPHMALKNKTPDAVHRAF